MTQTPTPPPASGSGRPKTLLEEASERIEARLAAKGIPVEKMPPRAPGELTVTFVPRQRQTPDPAAEKLPLSRIALELIGYLLSNDFVCPVHDKWMGFYFLVSEGKYALQVVPPAPKNEYQHLPYRDLHGLLISQIEFADKRGPDIIQRASEYLRQLNADQWITGLLTT